MYSSRRVNRSVIYFVFLFDIILSASEISCNLICDLDECIDRTDCAVVSGMCTSSYCANEIIGENKSCPAGCLKVYDNSNKVFFCFEDSCAEYSSKECMINSSADERCITVSPFISLSSSRETSSSELLKSSFLSFSSPKTKFFSFHRFILFISSLFYFNSKSTIIKHPSYFLPNSTVNIPFNSSRFLRHSRSFSNVNSSFLNSSYSISSSSSSFNSSFYSLNQLPINSASVQCKRGTCPDYVFFFVLFYCCMLILILIIKNGDFAHLCSVYSSECTLIDGRCNYLPDCKSVVPENGFVIYFAL
jgi:hypothetical protein